MYFPSKSRLLHIIYVPKPRNLLTLPLMLKLSGVRDINRSSSDCTNHTKKFRAKAEHPARLGGGAVIMFHIKLQEFGT